MPTVSNFARRFLALVTVFAAVAALVAGVATDEVVTRCAGGIAAGVGAAAVVGWLLVIRRGERR